MGGGCSRADSPFTYLSYEVHGSQLCKGDLVRVMDQGSSIAGPGCGLGEYERLTEIARP